MRQLDRAVVVGGAGFLGTWLVSVLRSEDIETTVLDPRGESRDDPATIMKPVDAAELGELISIREADVVFQLAGTGVVPSSIARPIEDLTRNAATTVAVLEAARYARRRPLVVYVSSAAVYGDGTRFPMDEDHPLRPLSPYGISKLAAEQYVALYARTHNVEGFSVRPFSLYGPGQRKLVVYDLLRRLFSGENPLVVAGVPSVTRDFVYVGDASKALVALAKRAAGVGEAYNLASGAPCTLNELANTLVRASGTGASVAFTGELRVGDPVRWEGDGSRARALGALLSTPLVEGIETTAAWVEADLRIRNDASR
jgi:UDP-glucose 4-epimerase